MNLPDRHMLIGMSLGALCGVAVGTIGPGMVFTALADEFTVPTFNPSQLVKFEGRKYQIENEDWVSADATDTAVVKKVEGGKVTYVTITTTDTGTYSTDALFSRHVQYPGVSVTDVTRRPANRFSYWTHNGWSAFSTTIGNSFTYFGASRR